MRIKWATGSGRAGGLRRGRMVGVFLGILFMGGAFVIPQTPVDAGGTLVASDTFQRTLESSWGSAEAGGSYTLLGDRTDFRVDSSRGVITLPASAESRGVRLPGVTERDVDSTTQFSLDRLPLGGHMAVSLSLRRSGAGTEYRGRVQVAGDGRVSVEIVRLDSGRRTSLASEHSAGLVVDAGQKLHVRMRAVGSDPAVVALKVWPATATQPTPWLARVEDHQALSEPGSMGLRTYLGPTTTALPLQTTFHELNAKKVRPKSPSPSPTPVPTPSPTPVPTPSPTPVPQADDAVALGAYIPGAPSDPSKIDAYAALTGRMPAVVMWYQSWSGPWNGFYARGADAIHARGSMPMISWEPWAGLKDDPQWSLASINAGSHDAYIRTWARDVAAWGKPIYVRPMYEMNGTWTSWSPGVNGNTAAQFREAWRHVVGLVRAQGASNITWVWAPNVDDGNPRFTPYADVYPGDAYVDWVGLDGYNWGTAQSWSSWQSLRSVFASSIEQIGGVTNKPLMIAEIGSSELGGDKAAWIRDGYARLRADFPEVRMVIWFHANKETDWRVDSSVASRDAYRAVVAGKDFSGTVSP